MSLAKAKPAGLRSFYHRPLLLCGVSALLLSGCQASSKNMTASRPPVPTDDNAALTEYIANEAYVTVEPAYRAAHILWKGDVFDGDFAALTQTLEEGRVINPHWDYAPDALIDRASVGYLLCRACDVRSGLNWQLTGLGRYAWRELGYAGVADTVSEYGYVPGGQFVGMLARAEERYQRGTADRVKLGEPPK